jgi:hypothetical protein
VCQPDMRGMRFTQDGFVCFKQPPFATHEFAVSKKGGTRISPGSPLQFFKHFPSYKTILGFRSGSILTCLQAIGCSLIYELSTELPPTTEGL